MSSPCHTPESSSSSSSPLRKRSSRIRRRSKTSETADEAITKTTFPKKRRHIKVPPIILRSENQSFRSYIRRMKILSRSSLKREGDAQETSRTNILAAGKELPDFLQMEESDGEEYDRKEFEINNEDEEIMFENEDYVVDWLDEGLEGSSSNKGIGDTRLWGAMPVTELSELVGWATHLDDTNNGSEDVENVEKQHGLARSVDLRCAVAREVIPTFIKPWIHIPSPPPKPSHLIFLSRCAERKIEHIQERMMKEPPPMQFDQIQSNSNVHSDDSSSFITHFLSASDDDNDNNTCFRSFETQKRMKRSLTQRPEGFQNNGIDVSQSQLNEASNVVLTMDETALISVGIMVEEAMTAMMIPLAREHVAHCRRLELKEEIVRERSEVRGVWSGGKKKQVRLDKVKEASFVDWTLPPIHAITNLVGKSPFGFAHLSSTLPPTMSSTMVRRLHVAKKIIPKQMDIDTPRLISQKDVMSVDDKIHLQHEAINHWCNMHGFDTDFVANNTDIFRLFLDQSIVT